MPNIGLRYAKYNKHNSDDTNFAALGTGGAVPVLGRIIDEKCALNYATGDLYADDALAETYNSFSDGTLTITVADDDDETVADILGSTVTAGAQSTDPAEITRNVSDTSPYIGYGHIITKVKNNINSYKVEFFPKCKAVKVTHDAKTKGNSIEFTTTSVELKVMALTQSFNGLPAGVWEKHKTFSTYAAAQTYLDGLLTPPAVGGGGGGG